MAPTIENIRKQAKTKTQQSGVSALVKRLIQAREDRAKFVVRRLLLQHSDQRLKSALGFTDEDIRALRRDCRS